MAERVPDGQTEPTDPTEPTDRTRRWAQTMAGHVTTGPGEAELVRAHADSYRSIGGGPPLDRQAREAREAELLRPGATLAHGAGSRATPEEPHAERTCFERDRDRIVHSPAFRRLAGKTQVVVHPRDHERTRLTHALEVAQVATSIARIVGANVALTDAIALGHDCGHGPGGHASEDAFDPYVAEGYDHGPWGADVVLTSLNLCQETLDGIRNHSWSRPAPMTVEGEIVSWSDRIAYCAHDLEDAVHAGIVAETDLPTEVSAQVGPGRREQLSTFIGAVGRTVLEHGEVGMDSDTAGALAALRAFNYERIYTRPESVAQSQSVIMVLQALVEFFAADPGWLDEPDLDPNGPAALRAAVAYVGGMTDRYAFRTAVDQLGWDPTALPPTVGR